MAGAEETINLLDIYWFQINILQEKPSLSTSATNFDHQNEEKPSELDVSVSELSGKSTSDQTGSLHSFSPVSVLSRATLQTIHSGKEVGEHEGNKNQRPQSQTSRRKVKVSRRKKSKSLSELEFEELKGFMDLGFVFSKEDKDPKLVSIVPGLQRLGKEEENCGSEEDGSAVSRPYLSEAWETMFDSKPVINWKAPPFSNEVDVKDSLRWWAQSVASAVR